MDYSDNETIRVLLERRTVRAYTDEPLSEEQLDLLTRCALWAPSARNRQSTHIRVVTDKALLDRLNRDFKDTVGWDTPAYTRWDVNPVYQTAPCMFFVFSDEDCGIDAGILVENIAIAAKAIGLDSCIIGSVGALFDGAFAAKWKKILKVGEKERFLLSIAVGHGTEAPAPKPRTEGRILHIISGEI